MKPPDYQTVYLKWKNTCVWCAYRRDPPDARTLCAKYFTWVHFNGRCDSFSQAPELRAVPDLTEREQHLLEMGGLTDMYLEMIRDQYRAEKLADQARAEPGSLNA